MEQEDLLVLIKQAIKEAIQESYPKEWLTKKELCHEFSIEGTLVWKMINDPIDPLMFSTIGEKKQLFKRDDINAYLEKRKRNVPFNKTKR